MPHRRTHSYTLERYSLTAEEVIESFAPYIARFHDLYAGRNRGSHGDAWCVVDGDP